MVNSFVPDALLNIAFIFNFSKSDAFGVYVPSLDRAIKTKALTQQLKSKGYDIVQEGDMLTAKPTKEEKNYLTPNALFQKRGHDRPQHLVGIGLQRLWWMMCEWIE